MASTAPALWRKRAPIAPDRQTLFNAIALFLLAASLFGLRIDTTRTLFPVNNCVLGADTGTYGEGLEEGRYGAFRVRKHPLAVIGVSAIATPLISAGIASGRAGAIALALIQAWGAVALFLFLRRNFLRDGAALAVVLLFHATFSTLTLLSIVESYGVTLAAAATTLLVAGEAARLTPRAPLTAGVAAAIAGIVAGWANPPALLFLLAYPGLAWRQMPGVARRLLWTLAFPLALGVVGTAIPTLLLDGGRSFAWQDAYIQRYADPRNFILPTVLLDFLSSFLVFPLVAPLGHIQPRYDFADLQLMFSSLLRPIAWAATAAFLALGTGAALRRRDRQPFAFAMLAIAGGFFCFYLYFNPAEALLYSPQWVLALVVAAAAGLGSSRTTISAAIAAALLCLCVNATMLAHVPAGGEDCCAAVPDKAGPTCGAPTSA